MVDRKNTHRSNFNQTIQNDTIEKKKIGGSEVDISMVSMTQLNDQQIASTNGAFNQIDLQPVEIIDPTSEGSAKNTASKHEEAITPLRTKSITTTQRRTRSVRKQ